MYSRDGTKIAAASSRDLKGGLFVLEPGKPEHLVAPGSMPMLIGWAAVVIGLSGAIVLSRSMKSLLFEVSPVDPWTYAGVCVLLLFAALLASYVPSRRATRIDPIESLRAE